MEDIRIVVASNIVDLRSKAGMKQADLAEKINYTDKSVSKWERAESLPDVIVLKSIADVFGVSLDYMVSDHNAVRSKEEEKEQKRNEREEKRNERRASRSSAVNHTAIALIVTVSIMSLAVAVFLILSPLCGKNLWYVLTAGVAVSCIPLLVFNSLWGIKRNSMLIIMVLIITLLATLYLILIKFNVWEIFLLVIPAAVIVWLSFNIKKPISKHEDVTLEGVE